jgi:hypothetical protein
MFQIAIILFALAAVAGLSMAVMHFRGQTPPRPMLAAVHGIFAASGLAVLLIAIIQAATGGMPAIAFCLFLLAALGGFALLSYHLRRRALPNGLVIGHALIAVTAFVMLLAAVYVVRP